MPSISKPKMRTQALHLGVGFGSPSTLNTCFACGVTVKPQLRNAANAAHCVSANGALSVPEA